MSEYVSKYTGSEIDEAIGKIVGGLADAVSPTASVKQTADGATISITDKDGTTTATIRNGVDGKDGSAGAPGAPGAPGADGSDGVGVSNIYQKTTSVADGGENVYVIELTDGTVSNFKVRNGSKGSAGADGSPGADGKDGADGQDGVSPTVSVSKSGKVTTLTITDVNGTKTATINDGADGAATDVPDYVVAEAERVAEAVKAARTAKSLVLLCASDIHTLMTNTQSVETTLHLAQGMRAICERIAVDGIAILGDSATGGTTSTVEDCKAEINYLKEQLGSAHGTPQIWMAGNHDHNSQNSSAGYLTADELYAHIGANTTEKAVTDYDNLHRMYGYVDYERQRIRVIYLNTSDITDKYASDYGMSTVQAQWLVDTLAAIPSGWGVVVMSHHPLNGYISTYLGTLTILDAYKGKLAGSVTVGGGTVTYDFADATGELICHLHGHIHNYQVASYGTHGVLSVTIPNGSFWRNNEYGSGGNTDWGDEVDGAQRVINKTAGTAADTAYTAIVIDRKNGKVHALRCGAGVDRVWDYLNGVEVDGETPEQPEEPDVPDTPTTGYTNQIPISVGTDGGVYNGTGYKAGYRLSTSSGNESAAAGMTVTGFIPVTPSSVVRVKDIDMTSGDSTYAVYSSSFAKAASGYCNSDWTAADANGVRYYTLNGSTNFAYIRVSGAFGENPIITVDEEITD